MKLNKLLLTASVLALCAAPAMAQDFGDFGGFDDEASGSSGSALEVSGTVSTDVRAYVDVDDTDELEVEAKPAGNLSLAYSGNNSDLTLSLCMDADKIQNNPEDIIDELVLRGRLGDYLTVEAGKMKVVWGKGDKLHVLDNFNADNYSNFIIPDYIDRRVSTPMLRAVISAPIANLNVEGIYTPLLPVDRFATSGRWTPAQVRALTGALTEAASENVTVAFRNYTTATANVGGAGAAYEISKESALKAKTSLETANTALTTAQTAFEQAKPYETLVSGYKLAAQQYAQAGQTVPSFEDFAAAQNVNTVQLEALRHGYAKASAALYAATVAQQTAQTTYDGYSEAEQTALAEYTAAKAEAEKAGAAYMYALTNANALSADPSMIYPDLKTLKYGQFGGRATWTLGQIDMGLSYYNGWYKQPSVNAEKLDSFITKYLAEGKVSEEDKFLAYDKKQTFGVEASSILWHFNVRGEFAYNLTDDTDGTDPWVHNNSIGWLGGFDIDLPFANANLNVQEIGTYILNNDECEKNTLDVDYAENAYTNNKLAANLTASFMNDKIAPEVTVMYGFENKDLVVMPKLSFKADQNLTLAASGMYIWCGDDNSEFKMWEKNSFVNISAKYQF